MAKHEPTLEAVRRQMREAPPPALTFDVKMVVVEGDALRLAFASGVWLEIPLTLIPEVNPAASAIRTVRVREDAVEWPDLDVYLNLAGLVVDALGFEVLRREVAKRNGAITLAARAAASAANGIMDGRPKKTAP